MFIHFAGLKSVSESFDKALDYYENNEMVLKYFRGWKIFMR